MVVLSLVYVVGAVGPFFGDVEWQWRQAGFEAWSTLLLWHLSWDRVVSEASEKGRLGVKWDACGGETERTEAARSKVAEAPCACGTHQRPNRGGRW